MGRMKEHPRYNVISLRVSDAELAKIKACLADSENVSDFLRDSALFIATFRTGGNGFQSKTI